MACGVLLGVARGKPPISRLSIEHLCSTISRQMHAETLQRDLCENWTPQRPAWKMEAHSKAAGNACETSSNINEREIRNSEIKRGCSCVTQLSERNVDSMDSRLQLGPFCGAYIAPFSAIGSWISYLACAWLVMFAFFCGNQFGQGEKNKPQFSYPYRYACW